jgi:hypothetical protein
MDIHILSLLGFGFLLGLKHALDIDHIAAVSTIVKVSKNVFRSTYVGMVWGVGHLAALFVVGLLVILFKLRIPEHFSQWIELAVAIMLVGFGVHLLWKIFHGAVLHVHTHEHDKIIHIHPHVHTYAIEHQHDQIPQHHQLPFSRKPLFIGILHGLAGSSGVMLVVLATISSPAVGFFYLLIFGAGSTVGMMLMTALISVPISLAGGHVRATRILQFTAGTFSIVMGIILAGQILFS